MGMPVPIKSKTAKIRKDKNVREESVKEKGKHFAKKLEANYSRENSLVNQ